MGFEKRNSIWRMLLIRAHVANDNRGFYGRILKKYFLLKMGWTFL